MCFRFNIMCYDECVRVTKAFACSTFALFAAMVAAPAHAQEYPNRPITLVVPYAAGGGNDLFARIASEKMSRTLGHRLAKAGRAVTGGRPMRAPRFAASRIPSRTRSAISSHRAKGQAG